MIRLSSTASYSLIVLFILLSQHVAGQRGMLPCGLNYAQYQKIPEKVLPTIDTTALARQRQHSSPKTILETVAYNFKTHFVPDEHGYWKTIVPGVDSWFLKLRSTGANGLAVVLSGLRLLPGESLYVYNQHGLRGPFTNQNIPRSGILPLDYLQGDELMIEYNVPAGSKSHGTFIVETLSHAYRNVFDTHDRHKGIASGRYSDDCYLCMQSEAITTASRAVVKLIVQYENSAKLCTGTLVNNTANDKRPYILTAEHCVSNQAEADRTIFIFGYDDEKCFNQTRYDLVLSGAHHRASLFENDFTLLELYDKPPLEFHPYYAGWDISDQHLNGVIAIHHAEGGPKRVSVSNATIITGDLKDGTSRTPDAFWNVTRWDIGATESGSSGASLLNNKNHVIGTLSGGSSKCGAPYNDFFAKLSEAWEASSNPGQQLKYWLDPVHSGVKQLEGVDPFEGITVNCKTISNIKSGEQQELFPYTNGAGYFSGYNSDGIASYAERFSLADSMTLTGAMLNVGSVNVQSAGGLMVSIHRSITGVPGPAVSETFVPYDRLREDSLNYVAFNPYVKVTGDFFISYTLGYSPGDSFALKQASWRSNSDNTAFVKLASGWVPMNIISPDKKATSLGIKIAVCEDTVIVPHIAETVASFYPNPATDVLIAKLPGDEQDTWQVQVYDLQGKQQRADWQVYENTVVITTADLASGMFIVRISSAGWLYQSKFIKL